MPSPSTLRRAFALALALAFAGCVDSRDATGTAPGAGGGDGATGEPAPPRETKLSVAAVAPYAYNPKALAAETGAFVNLTFVNEDPLAPHNWILEEADAATDVLQSGQSTTLLFFAPEAGTYEYYCSVGNHRQLGMVGTFTVT